MSETPLTIDSGVIPCSSLYATWYARRRSLLHRADDRLRALVRVQEHLAGGVAGGATGRLDGRRLPAQEALLVGVENGDERHLREVEALAQEVHADEDVELAEAQLADDGDAVERVDLRVEVARTDSCLEQVVREVFGHLLRQRRHEHALTDVLAVADLVEEVVDLVLGGAQLDVGVHDTGGRMSCSAITFERDISNGPGVAETKTSCFTFPRNSSNRSGRLSSADGSRNPSR